MREFTSGYEAIMRGAAHARCDFFATVATNLIDSAVQVEDEPVAVGQCIGAAMAGARSMAFISSRGLPRCVDEIGFAQAAEVPLVIVCRQGAGSLVAGECDVTLARSVISGGCPLPVLSVADVASAYRLTCEAFNVAERLRTPVVLMVAEQIVRMRQTVDLDGDGPRVAAKPDTDSGSPPLMPVGGLQRATFECRTRLERNTFRAERAARERKLAQLTTKIAIARETLEYTDADADPRADVLVLSYGLADGVAREAVAELRRMGKRAARLTLYTLWPVPQSAIRRAATRRIRRIVVPELNIGLYAGEIRKIVESAAVEQIVRYDGGLIHPQRIVQHVLRSPCG